MKDVINKFKFKGDAVVLYAPSDIEEQCVQLGFSTSLPKKSTSTNTLVFVNNKKEFVDFLNKQLKQIEPDSVLWFAYPKGTSGIKTDINRDLLWACGEEYGITSVSAISIDTTWSALRFRPIERVGKK